MATGKHRAAIGGAWDVIGPLQLQFMQSRGLEPRHKLVDVGCGSLRCGLHFTRYLDKGHYYGLDINASLIEAGKLELAEAGLEDRTPHLLVDDGFRLDRFGVRFDYAIAHSLFTHLSMNRIIRCLAAVKAVLQPGGELYGTFFETPAPLHLEPLRHPHGTVTHFDANPFHYSFSEMRAVAELAGMSAELIGKWGHPRGQHMIRFAAAP